MSSNGIHLFELLLMNIAISSRLALRLSNLPTTNTVELVRLAIFVFLFASLFYHLRFNLCSFFPYAIHDFLCLDTEVRLWALEAKVEGRRGHFIGQRAFRLGRRLLRRRYESRLGWRTSHARKDIAEALTRCRWLDSTLVDFAWVHFLHRRLHA